MKKLIVLLLVVMMLTACGQDTEKDQGAVYVNITAEEAKGIMDSEEGYIILDVREQDEYDAFHIPGAILIPYTQIEEKAAAMLPDKDQLILVYCRSGRRSKIAAQSLAELGYTNIKEFGGIIDCRNYGSSDFAATAASVYLSRQFSFPCKDYRFFYAVYPQQFFFQFFR